MPAPRDLTKFEDDVREFLRRRDTRGATIAEIADALGLSYDVTRRGLRDLLDPFPHRRPKHQWSGGWVYYVDERAMSGIPAKALR